MTGSVVLRDEVALRASRGLHDFDGLLGAMDGGSRLAPSRPAPLALAWAGYLAAGVPSAGPLVAERLMRRARQLATDEEARTFGADLDIMWAQLQHHLGHEAEVDGLLDRGAVHDEHAWAIRADRVNPFVGDGGDLARWQELLSQPFVHDGLAAPRLGSSPASAGGAPIYQLTTSVADRDDGDGRLVSIVMPVYDPDPDDLHMALTSMTSQTWRDLEVLVCDDASSDAGREVISSVASEDDRVRVLRLEHNAGAYTARNRGLTEARGDLVTFQDSDDWSHPERVARQVAALGVRPDAVASLSRSVRATGFLELVQIGQPPTRPNLSSLMIRRDPVVDRLGAFDALRRGADSEFVERIAAVFGEDALVEMEQHLAVVQLTGTSLSRADFSFGWMHPARLSYVGSFQAWHRSLRHSASRHSPLLRPGRRAPFPAPAHLLGAEPLPVEAPVAMLADMHPATAGALDPGSEVAALVEVAGSVVVVDAIDPVDLHRGAAVCNEPLEREVAGGSAHKLEHGQTARVDLLVVRSPALAELRDGEVLRRLSFRRAVVVVEAHAIEKDRLPTTAKALGEHGRHVSWLPADDRVASALSAALPGADVLAARRWCALEDVGLFGRDGRSLDRVAVDPGLPQAREDALAFIRQLALHRASPPTSWAVRPERHLLWSEAEASIGLTLSRSWFGDSSTTTNLDAAVLPAAPGSDVPRQHLLVQRCLARGLVVLADPALAASYPGVVVPIRPAGVPATLDVLRARPQQVERLRTEGVELVRRLASPAGIRSVLSELLDQTPRTGQSTPPPRTPTSLST